MVDEKVPVVDGEAEKKNYWPYILSGIVFVVVAFFGLRLLFAGPSVPNEYLSAYDAQHEEFVGVFRRSVFNFSDLQKNVGANNLQGVIAMLTVAIANVDENKEALQSLEAKTVNLRLAIGKISDGIAIDKAQKLMDLVTERNAKIAALNTTERELFIHLKSHYQSLLSGGSGGLSQNVDVVAQGVQNSLQELVKIQSQIDILHGELVELAKQSGQGNFLQGDTILRKMNAPFKPSPTPFFIPTAIPIQDEAAGPMGSPSAVPQREPTEAPGVSLTPTPEVSPTPAP